MTPTTRPQLRTFFRDTPAEEENWPQIALASEIRAIELSWRACGACGALALGVGLGFPVGHLQPPLFSNSKEPRITFICEVQVMARINPNITFGCHQLQVGPLAPSAPQQIKKSRSSAAPALRS